MVQLIHALDCVPGIEFQSERTPGLVLHLNVGHIDTALFQLNLQLFQLPTLADDTFLGDLPDNLSCGCQVDSCL